MKFTCMQPDLSQAIGSALGALADLPPQEAGQEMATLTATEARGVTLTLSRPLFSVTGWLRANIDRPGRVLLPLQPLHQVVAAMPSQDLCLELHPTGGLSIRSGPASVQLHQLTPQEAPQQPPSQPAEPQLHLPAGALRQALKATTFAASQDQNHPAIPRGIHLQVQHGTATLEATDEHRYAQCTLPTGAPGDQPRDPIDIIVPLDALLTLQQRLQDRDTVAITLEPDPPRATFRYGRTRVQTRLLVGPYPRVQAQIHPDQDNSPSPTTIEVSTNQLEQALSLCELTKSPGARVILIEAQDNRARITSTGMEQARVDGTLQAQVERPPIRAAFNAGYLLQVLQSVQACPSTLLTIRSHTDPCTLTFPAHPGILHAVMPTLMPGGPQARPGP